MALPGVVQADILGMRELSGWLEVVGEDAAAVARLLYGVPAPTVAGYGWQCVVDSMAELLRAWSAEVDLLRQTCDALSRAVRRAADGLEGVDTLAGDELAAILPGR